MFLSGREGEITYMQNRSLKTASFNINGVLNPVKRWKMLSKLKKDKIQISYRRHTSTTLNMLNRINQDLNMFTFLHIYRGDGEEWRF